MSWLSYFFSHLIVLTAKNAKVCTKVAKKKKSMVLFVRVTFLPVEALLQGALCTLRLIFTLTQS